MDTERVKLTRGKTTILRHLLSHILAAEEDWLGAAQALMKIPLEGGSRYTYSIEVMENEIDGPG